MREGFLHPAISRAAAVFVFAAGACWVLLIGMAVDFSAVPGSAAVPGAAAGGGVDWRGARFLPLFAMWAVMMAAMMLPSFAPAAFSFARLLSRRPVGAVADMPAAALLFAFVGGYLFVWGGFSIAVSVLQQLAAQQLSAALYFESPLLRAALLFAAGVFQFTSFKFSCLKHCRHPIFFFLLHWQDGVGGAWRMGVRHGLFCLGCCWLLMLLLFVGGAMDLRWIALLTLYVLAEKLSPFPPRYMARAAGVLLFAAAAAQAA